MLENLKPHNNITIRYSTEPTAVEIDPSCPHLSTDYPVTVTLTHVSESEPNGDGQTNVGSAQGLVTGFKILTVAGRQP